MVRQGVLTRRRLATAGPARAGTLWPGAAIVAALALLAYINAFHGAFLYDDRDTVVSNPSLRDLTNIRYVITFSLFRPFVNISYALDYAIWHLDPFGYHLTNIGLHVAAAVAWYLVVFRVTQDRNERRDTALPPAGIALASASLWAVHPLLAEAVAYVSGRSEILGALGLMVAFLALRHGVLHRSRTGYLGGVLAFLFSLGSKETAAVLPIVLVLWDRLFLDHEGFRRRFVRLHLPLIALVTVTALVRIFTLVSAEAGLLRTPWQNLLTQARVILGYASLVLLPAGQSIMHGVRVARDGRDLSSLIALCLIAAIAWGAWRIGRREPIVTFGVLWFFLLLVPSSSVIPLKEPMAEHRAYLAAAGLLLAIVTSALTWLPRPGVATLRRLVIPALIGLLVLTWTRNGVWADPVRVWAEAVRTAPNQWEAHYALADALREQQRCAEAVSEYESVLKLSPVNRDAANNLGICLAQLGQYERSRAAFRAAIQIDPRFARAYNNLGNLALVTGDRGAARQEFARALDYDVGNVTARRQLAAISEADGQYADAVRYCHELMGLLGRTPDLLECIRRNEERLRTSR